MFHVSDVPQRHTVMCWLGWEDDMVNQTVLCVQLCVLAQVVCVVELQCWDTDGGHELLLLCDCLTCSTEQVQEERSFIALLHPHYFLSDVL